MDLTAERVRVLNHAKGIVETAKAANRDLTDQEQDRLTGEMEKIKTLDRQIKGRELVTKFRNLGGPEDDEDQPRPSLFDERARDGFMEAIKSKSIFRGSVDRASMLTKAGPILEGTLIPPSGQGVSPPLYPSISVPAITDLMPTVAVGTPTVRYWRVSAGVAAVVTEGSAKPDAGITPTAVDVVLAKIAATLQISDEASDDAPFLLSAFQQALVNAVVSKENEEVVSTLAATSGILTKAGAATDIIDLLADAVASMQAVGTSPNAVLVNPSTLAVIRKAKASGSGVYLAVDPLAAGPTTVHGVPVYAVNATGAATAWVIDGTGLTYFRRQAVSFELGWNNDDWNKNVRTARAETRGKCGVLQPLAVCKVGPLT